MKSILYILVALGFAVSTQLATATNDQREVRFSLISIEERCIEPTAAQPECYLRVTTPAAFSEGDVSDAHTVKRSEMPIPLTLSQGSSIGVCVSSSGIGEHFSQIPSWSVTFHEWIDDAAIIDLEYERESGCERNESLETRVFRQLMLPVPSRQRVGETIRTTLEGDQRIVTADYIVLVAEPER